MQTKSLQTKRALRTALLVLLLSVAGMGEGYANYSFSAVCPTGQTLYYKITNSAYHYVALVYPTKTNGGQPWSGFTKPIGDIVLPSIVTYNGTEYTVTSIGESAFYNCSDLTGILIIPNSVITLGKHAFSYCSGFTGNLTIPNSVTTIGDSAFSNCTGFNGTLTFGNSLQTIGNNAFASFSYYGAGLHFVGDLVIPNSVTVIGDGAFLFCTGFTGNLTIGNSVTTIGRDAFRGCSGFTGSLTIPNSVTTIGYDAFRGCSGFTGSLTIPNSVTTIERGTFSGCSGFTGPLAIPNSVRSVSGPNYVEDYSGAFQGCRGLTSVTMTNVTSIGEKSFYGCSNLISVTIPNSVTSIGKSAFSGTGWYAAQPDGSILYLNQWCLGHKGTPTGTLVLRAGTRGIADEAFINRIDLTSITIPETVVFIGKDAFKNCSGLKEINFNAKDCIYDIWSGCTEVTTILLGDFVENVKANMFSNFENLTTVTIGKSVKSILGGAFANNPRLNMIYYNVEKDLGASTDVFENCPNLTTIHIGPEVKEIGSNIFKGCNTVHFVVALGSTPAVLDAGAFSDIVDNSVLMVSCGKRVTYYSVWNMFPFNNIIEDCDTYGINVGAVGSGGTITPSVTEAQMGQEVQITITPNPGMVLVSIKVVNANDPTQIIPISPSGKAASTYSFTMPPFEVVVMATFKNSGTSVGENNSVEVAVYPNPTNGLVKIEAESIKHVSISNMLGQVVFNGKVDGGVFEYDFSGQKAGIYLVRIETTSGVAVKKVSVTR